METEDAFFYGITVIMYIYLSIINNVFTGAIRGILNGVGLALFIMTLFLQDLIVQMRIAPFIYLEMRVYPENKRLHVFVKNIISRRAPGWFSRWETRLELGFKARVQKYDKVQIVELQHKDRWQERVLPGPGRANYHGFTVDHPQTAMLIVYTPGEGAFTFDHGNPIPRFYLRFSPSGDYERERREGFTDLFGSMAKMPRGADSQLTRQLEILRQKYHDVEAFAASKSIEAMDEHRRRVQLEEVVTHQRNETRGLVMALSDKTDATTNRMLDVRKEQITIENALKNAGKQDRDVWVKILRAATPVLVIVIIAYFLSSNPEILRQIGLWFSSPINSVLILLLIIAAGVTYYYWRRRR